MRLAFGMVDSNPKSVGRISSRCVWCGSSEKQEIYVIRRLLMIFFIPFTIKTNMYVQCPNCGSIKVLTKDERKKVLKLGTCI